MAISTGSPSVLDSSLSLPFFLPEGAALSAGFSVVGLTSVFGDVGGFSLIIAPAAGLVFLAASVPASTTCAASRDFVASAPASATFAISVALVTDPAVPAPFIGPISMAISAVVPPIRCPGVSSVILYSSRLNCLAFVRPASATSPITLACFSVSGLPNTFPQKANERADSSASRAEFSIPPLMAISPSPTAVLLTVLAMPFCCSIGFHPLTVDRSCFVSLALSTAAFPNAFPIVFSASHALISGLLSGITTGFAS
ncbi:hypothetical protein Xsze_02046 [Xenorhabdus szentirmaii DSM 16338]|nr:hypothetical protein Xsze_02046 [Xenorhabdus szentirmaii DSM 16338]